MKKKLFITIVATLSIVTAWHLANGNFGIKISNDIEDNRIDSNSPTRQDGFYINGKKVF